MGRNNSESPVRARVSPRRRSPSRRERSPGRHRHSENAETLSSRNRSPKQARPRSPGTHSSVRDKVSGRTKSSPKYRRSPSPASRSPGGQKKSGQVSSQKLVKSRSPIHLSPMKEKPSSRTRSPKRLNSRSSVSPITARSITRSPSPRSKRLKAARAEQNAGKGNERDYERNQERKLDRPRHEERDAQIERNDRRPERDASRNDSRSGHRHSVSPLDRNRRGQRRSLSPYGSESRGRNELANTGDEDQRNGESDSLAKMRAAEEKLEAKGNKQEPSFELSGKLAAETNRVRGVTLLFNEPPDARKPDIRWRLYVFKGGEVLNEPLYVHRQSCYLFGRERRVADIPTDHPSCSKQHAVLQYRQVEVENPDGMLTKKVRPYLMDLGSTNGTFINENRMEPQRYYELFEKDTVKFGNSSREYVILHENSAT